MTNSILVRDFSGIRLAELREEIQRVREYGNKNQTVIYLYEYHDDSPIIFSELDEKDMQATVKNLDSENGITNL